MPRRDHLTIVHLSTEPSWYGGEEQAWLLALGLRHRGHRCVIWGRRDGAFAARMRREGFEVGTFSARGRNPLAVLSLHMAYASLHPDVLHFHDAHALTVGGTCAFFHGIKARVAARRSTHPVHVPWKYRRLCNAVIAVSESVAETCVSDGVPADLLRVVHDGVDATRVEAGCRDRGRRALDIDERRPVILVVASLRSSKGHADLLRALPLVRQAEPRIRVVMAGDGPQRRSLQTLTRRLRLERVVQFLGYRQDIPDLLQAADLFVLPSRIEPLGSSVIDAMIAGIPIVTTSAGGLPELVGPNGQDGALAWIASPRQPRHLAESIVAALRDPAARRDRAARARERALRHFTADLMVDRTLDVYRELLGEGTEARRHGGTKGSDPFD